MNGNVIHPAHYQGKKECWNQWIDIFGADGAVIACLANVHKYLTRMGKKVGNSKEQDYAKAENYMDKADEIIEAHADELPDEIFSMYEKVYLMLYGGDDDEC